MARREEEPQTGSSPTTPPAGRHACRPERWVLRG